MNNLLFLSFKHMSVFDLSYIKIRKYYNIYNYAY